MATDPFDLLGLAPRFDLDTAALARIYLKRSAALHPDTAGADPDAARNTAALNEARATLEDPLRRAEALLARLGGPSKEQDRSLPAGFLAEIMEVREAADYARSTNDLSGIARWQDWAEGRRAAHIAGVAELFASLPAPPAPAPLKAIRTELNAWRYIERMAEQLDPASNPARDARSETRP